MKRDTKGTDVFDPGKYYSAQAYTTPAVPIRDKRYPRGGVLLPMLAGAFIMAVIAGFVYLFFFYNMVVGPGLKHGISINAGEEANSSADKEFSLGSDDEPSANNGMHIAPPGAEAGHSINVSNNYDYEESLTVKSIYRKCAPSVVSISSTNADFTRFVLGSGIIMNKDGYIITSTHLVDNSGYINVKIYGGGEYPAYLVGEDEASGIAVIKIEAENLVPAEFGDFSETEVGSNVVSIGNPVEGSFAITDGVISSLCGTIKYGGFPVTVFQTNAQSGSGSSGAPVINEFGQVIGIINTDMSAVYELENLSFAVPISVAKPVIDELMDHGYVAGRPALGLELIDIPLSVSAYYGMPVGIFVEKVYEQSDAKAAGVIHGDIIVSINGIKISGMDELNEVKNGLKVGDKVVLGIVRNLEIHNIEVVLIDSAQMNE